MKKIIFTLLLFSFCSKNILFAQDIPKFETKFSHTLSVLRFMEATAKVGAYSQTYRQVIEREISTQNKEFRQLVADFQALNLYINYSWDAYPESRHSHRDIYDLINIAAVNANDLDDFSRRIIGMLPNEDFIKLIGYLKRAEPFHDAIFAKYKGQIKKQVKEYKPYQAQLGAIFSQVSNFYGTKWSKDIPFVVCLYPIPSNKGNSTATPHGNTLVCGFFVENKNDFKGRLPVVTHEMCHVLYDGQSAENQRNIERWMKNNPSKYKNLAYQYFDEGMATAIGNGWAFEVLHNRIDTTEWYNDEIIDGYGHALFPLVKSYLRVGKTMDSIFVNEAIAVFEKTFPKSINDYNVMLNNVFISGSFADTLVSQTLKTIESHFRISSRSLSTPFIDDTTKKDYLTTTSAKILLFSEDLKDNWAKLKELDPIIAQKFANIDGTPNTGQYFSFVDDNGKANLIIFYDDLKMLDAIFQQIKKERFIEQNQPLHQLKN